MNSIIGGTTGFHTINTTTISSVHHEKIKHIASIVERNLLIIVSKSYSIANKFHSNTNEIIVLIDNMLNEIEINLHKTFQIFNLTLQLLNP